MVDVTTGVTDLDEALTQELRKSKKPVVLVVNKVDNTERSYLANEFYSLGFDKYISISALHGTGIGELLEQIVLNIKDKK